MTRRRFLYAAIAGGLVLVLVVAVAIIALRASSAGEKAVRSAKRLLEIEDRLERQRRESPSGVASAVPETAIYRDERNGFEMPVPKNWMDVEIPNLACVFARGGSKPRLSGCAVSLLAPMPGLLTGRRTWEDVLRAEASVLKRPVIRRIELPCGSAPGLLYTITVEVDGREVGYLKYAVATPEHFYLVFWHCSAEDFPSMEPLFESWSREFRLIGKPSGPPAPARPSAGPLVDTRPPTAPETPRPAPPPVPPPPLPAPVLRPTGFAAPESRSVDRPKRRLSPAAIPPKGKKLIYDGYYLSGIRLGGLATIDLLPYLLWASDSRHVFVVEVSGVLHKIAIPEFVEVASCALGGKVRALQHSREGLVAVLESSREVLTIDETMLAPKRKIATRRASFLTSSPALGIAFAANEKDLEVIDLKEGKVVRTYAPQELWTRDGDRILRNKRSDTEFEYQTVSASPNGMMLFAVQDCRLTRFAIRGMDLLYEDIGPAIVKTTVASIWISPDSRYIAVPNCTTPDSVPGHLPLGRGGTYVYAVGDLQKPAVTLSFDVDPAILGWDPSTGEFYIGNRYIKLAVFGAEGKPLVGICRLGTGPPRCLLVHPESGELLLLIDNLLYWMQPP